jgi:hypothetical protein
VALPRSFHMKITPVPFGLELEHDDTRSPGLHLTQITSAIALKTGALDKRFENRDINSDVSGKYKVAAGLAWEEWIHKRHPEMLYHPGEVILNGIAMTTDGISFMDNKKHRVHEFKFTWKSMNRDKDLSGEWMWMAQTMAYCLAWETNRARWHLFWTNGDYRDSGPQYKLYDIEFTGRELRENWQAIDNNRSLVTLN